MPGIVGFHRSDPPGGADAFLSRVVRALEPEGGYRIDRFSDGAVGLGRVSLGIVNPDPQPVWNRDRSCCIVMEGELYDTPSNRTESALVPGSPERDPEFLLRRYEEMGESFAAGTNGAFAAAIWDLRAQRLVLANDRLGLFPLYYACFDGNLVFGSGVRAVMADPSVPRKVDLAAMHEFLVLDHVLGDRTLLQAVRLLPQGSTLIFEKGSPKISRHSGIRYPRHYLRRSEDELLEGLLHFLRQALKRQVTADLPTGLLLSGGLDSRILIGLLAEQVQRGSLHTFTWGVPGCDDARYSAEVARLLGVPHQFLELKRDWLAVHAERAVRLTDGLGNLVNLHALATVEEEASQAKVIFKGFLGDALLGFALKRQMWADYDPADGIDLHREIYESQGVLNYGRQELADLFSPDFLAEAGETPDLDFQVGMDRAETGQLAVQRLYFDLTQRVPRMTLNGVEVVRSRAVVRLPFADSDLLDFALEVPPGFLFERYLTKELLRRHFPALAKIPMTPTGLPLVSCARSLAMETRRFASWHLDRAGLGWLFPMKSRPYKDYNGWFRTTLRPWVEDLLLSQRSLQRGYFNPEYVRTLVASHMGGANHAVRLGALLTLETWHRQFLDGSGQGS